MKRLLVTILLLALCFSTLAQERVVLKMDGIIKVYIYFNHDLCFCHLPPSETDLFYDAQILEKKGSRFKLKITMRDITGEVKSEPIIGWVNSKDCGVYILCNEFHDQIPILFLYESPTLNSNVTYIDVTDIYKTWICIEDITNGFIKIYFDLDDIKYEGWINRYCLDIFSLCT